eukprot:6616061-Prymnesium_polylepis.1
MSTVTIDQLAPSTLAFASSPTERANNKKHVETTLDTGKAPPNVQLSTDKAPLRIPFGMSAPYGDEEGGQRHTLEVSASPELAAWAGAIDEALVQHAVKHSQAWFGEALDEATVLRADAPPQGEPEDRQAVARRRPRAHRRRRAHGERGRRARGRPGKRLVPRPPTHVRPLARHEARPRLAVARPGRLRLQLNSRHVLLLVARLKERQPLAARLDVVAVGAEALQRRLVAAVALVVRDRVVALEETLVKVAVP